MNRNHYILNSDGTLTTAELLVWAEWFETADRNIALDILPDGTRISTVFLGIDHRFGSAGPPLLFETMIFGGPHDQHQDRYATRDEALMGHALAVKLAKAAASEPQPELQRGRQWP